MNSKQKVKIEDWCLTDVNYLNGKVQDHPRFTKGKEVTTSKILSLDTENYETCEINNTIYLLGKPSEDWVNWLLDNNFESGKILKAKHNF